MESTYAALVRSPGFLRLAAASIIARLPMSMVGVAGILLLRDRLHSYATAGAAVALYGAGAAVTSPALGRLAARRGPRRVVVGVAAVRAGLLVALVAIATTGLAAPVLIAALLAGAAEPPVTPVVRASFSHLPPGVRETALSVDSVLVEAVFLTGPLLVGLVVLVGTAGWALVAAGVLGLAGALLTNAEVPVQIARERGVLRIASVRVVLAVSAVQVVAFATVETAFTAACRDSHRPALSGVLGALWATGSACGGLAYGLRRTWKTSAATRYLTFTVLVGALLLPLAATHDPDVLLALLPVAGLCIAPCVSSGSDLLSQTVPPHLRTEAFAWTAATAGAAGASLGYALGGSLVQTLGVRPSFLVAALVALAVTLSPLLERRGLRQVQRT